MNKGVLIAFLFLGGIVFAVIYLTFFRDLNAITPGAVCEVHNLTLEAGRVPIRYGLIRPASTEIDARQTQFPHARSFHLGGCEVTSISPRHARVSYCPECRKAEAAWMEKQE